jgi:hypothetical protein
MTERQAVTIFRSAFENGPRGSLKVLYIPVYPVCDGRLTGSLRSGCRQQLRCSARRMLSAKRKARVERRCGIARAGTPKWIRRQPRRKHPLLLVRQCWRMTGDNSAFAAARTRNARTCNSTPVQFRKCNSNWLVRHFLGSIAVLQGYRRSMTVLLRNHWATPGQRGGSQFLPLIFIQRPFFFVIRRANAEDSNRASQIIDRHGIFAFLSRCSGWMSWSPVPSPPP